MKPLSLLICGLAAFGCMLVLRAPAASVYTWLGPKQDSAAELFGLQGSIAEGRLSAVAVGGHLVARDLHWAFRPLWLPLLRLSFEIDGGGAPLNVSSRVDLKPAGIGLAGTEIGGPLKPLLGNAGLAYVPVDGYAQIKLRSLELQNAFPVAAAGTVEVHGLAWTLARNPLPLGDFRATISTDKDVILAHIEPVSGPIDASGDVHLMQDRSYDYDLQIKARGQADPVLQNMLQSLGKPDVQGYYRLRNRGSLAGPPPT